MTYARRFIDVTFSGGGQQSELAGGGPGGSLSFSDHSKTTLRTYARILHAGGFNYGTMQMQLFGLSLAHIKQLSTYGRRYLPDPSYRVKVDAGDDENGMSTVFVGSIRAAWGDMRAMPNSPFIVVANMNIGVDGNEGNAASKPIAPSSYNDGADVPTVLEKLAKSVNLTFENNGVSGKLPAIYHWGNPWKQIKEIADAANINAVIDNGVLAIWPKSGSRPGSLIISSKTGLRDYPAFTEYGVQVRTEFKSAVTYGSTMTIQGSDMTPANGDWNIIRIDYDLQANVPHGSWYAVLDGAKFGAPVTQL